MRRAPCCPWAAPFCHLDTGIGIAPCSLTWVGCFEASRPGSSSSACALDARRLPARPRPRPRPRRAQLLPGQVHSYGACQHNKEPDARQGDRGGEKRVRAALGLARRRRFRVSRALLRPRPARPGLYITQLASARPLGGGGACIAWWPANPGSRGSRLTSAFSLRYPRPGHIFKVQVCVHAREFERRRIRHREGLRRAQGG